LAKIVEWGLCTPSLVRPKPIRQLRDLTRYRRCLIRERTREKQRAEKLLEDAQIKISAVITDIFGVSGRVMMQALIAGQRNPKTLTQLARGKLRAKIDVLEEAFTGHFEDHHGFLLQSMLTHIGSLSAQADQVAARIDPAIAPFASTAERLDEISSGVPGSPARSGYRLWPPSLTCRRVRACTTYATSTPRYSSGMGSP
jgi:hypothetical protein